jgi:hypothetical protein
MSDYTINRVVSQYFPLDDFIFTYNLAAGTTMDHVGRALTLDTSADSQFKPAGDGDRIDGRLFQFEDRRQQGAGLVGSVERKFKAKLPVAAGEVVARGDTVVGAGDGFVKAAADADPRINTVVEVLTGFVVVEYL